MTGSMVYLKPECLQKNGSFKIRGAYTFLRFLSAEKKKCGVVTCSAGNWAQGVGYGCQLLGIKALILDIPMAVSGIKMIGMLQAFCAAGTPCGH